MSDRPIIMPLDNGLWQLVEEWDGIPAGFVTDGGSIPRLLWRVIGPPVDAQTIAPFIRHDWNYQTARVKRHQADNQLYADLRAAGVSRVRAYAIYAGVRAFGRSHYCADADTEGAEKSQL